MSATKLGTTAVHRFCYLTYFLLGLSGAMLGPSLPSLAARTGTDLADMGLMLSAVVAGGIPMNLLIGRVLDRRGQRAAMVVGLLFLGPGMAVQALAPTLPILLSGALFYGMGVGAMVVVTNVIIGDSNADNRPAALNRLNVFMGTGSLIGPMAMGFALQYAGAQVAFGTASVIWFSLLGLVLANTSLTREGRALGSTDTGDSVAVLRTPILWILGLMLFLNGGSMLGINGWLYTYFRTAAGTSVTSSALLTTGLWIGSTAGIWTGAKLLRKRSVLQLLPIWIGMACLGILILIAAPSLSSGWTVAAGIGAITLIGLGLGPVWSSLVGLGTTEVPKAAGRAASMMIFINGLGAMTIPWIQGKVLGASGPAWSMVVPLVGCLGVLGLYPLLRRAVKTRQSDHNPTPLPLNQAKEVGK